jgi:hypothetical protein
MEYAYSPLGGGDCADGNVTHPRAAPGARRIIYSLARWEARSGRRPWKARVWFIIASDRQPVPCLHGGPAAAITDFPLKIYWTVYLNHRFISAGVRAILHDTPLNITSPASKTAAAPSRRVPSICLIPTRGAIRQRVIFSHLNYSLEIFTASVTQPAGPSMGKALNKRLMPAVYLM